jgi:hypothetical protein
MGSAGHRQAAGALRVAPFAAFALAACTAPVETGSPLGAPSGDSAGLPARTPPPAGRPGASGDGGTSRPTTATTTTQAAPRADAGTSDAAVEAGAAAPPPFLDPFARADGPSVGNGWVEKMPGLFAIQNGTAFQTRDAAPYGDSFVSRPESEARLDVEVSADFLFPAVFANGPNGPPDPALYARIQAESSAAGTFTCYSLYVLPDLVGITRELHQAGGQYLTTGPIQPALVAGAIVHAVFRVRGTDPVTLDATITAANGTVLKTLSTTDTDPNRIVSAGSTGFGADVGALAFDNFAQSNLGGE